jgi:hypothetical protein
MATNKNKRATGGSYSAAEVNQLWDGTLGQVAKKLGRSSYAISAARTAFKRFKPGSGLIATEENLREKQPTAAKKSAQPAKKVASKTGIKRGPYKSSAKKATTKVGEASESFEMTKGKGGKKFKMDFNGQKLEFKSQPKSIRLSNDGLEVNF